MTERCVGVLLPTLRKAGSTDPANGHEPSESGVICGAGVAQTGGTVVSLTWSSDFNTLQPLKGPR